MHLACSSHLTQVIPNFRIFGFPPIEVLGNFPPFFKRICVAKPANAMASSAIDSNITFNISILSKYLYYSITKVIKLTKGNVNKIIKIINIVSFNILFV